MTRPIERSPELLGERVHVVNASLGLRGAGAALDALGTRRDGGMRLRERLGTEVLETLLGGLHKEWHGGEHRAAVADGSGDALGNLERLRVAVVALLAALRHSLERAHAAVTFDAHAVDVRVRACGGGRERRRKSSERRGKADEKRPHGNHGPASMQLAFAVTRHDTRLPRPGDVIQSIDLRPMTPGNVAEPIPSNATPQGPRFRGKDTHQGLRWCQRTWSRT